MVEVIYATHAWKLTPEVIVEEIRQNIEKAIGERSTGCFSVMLVGPEEMAERVVPCE